ncbi:response regulator [Roseateles oligotrophus]|uniref:histidine kinase n=1 Tax=Roseateles oligotrophus TaxID=1769250 RepID=A0ABT2YHY8_9BURK|nr:response regulator [Roseateles oligotrophus]MCV2369666.1 response regulator [Roseateles oligotrophus]
MKRTPSPTVEFSVSDEQLAAFEADLAGLQGEAKLSAEVKLAWHLRLRDSRRALALAEAAQAQLNLPGVKRSPARQKREAVLQARLLLVQAKVSMLNAEPAQAKALAQQAENIFALQGDHIGVGDALWISCYSLLTVANDAAVDTCLACAMEQYRLGGDTGRASAAQARQLLCAIFRDPAGKRAQFLQEFPLDGDYPEVARPWICSGRSVIAMLTEDPASAIKKARDMYAASAVYGNIRLMLQALIDTAKAYVQLGDLDGALEASERSLSLARPTGWPHSLGFCLLGLGELMRKLARHEEALLYLQEGLQVMSNLSSTRDYRLGLRSLAQLRLDMGDPAAALEQFERCEHRSNEPDLLISLCCGQAEALLQLDQISSANAKAERALALACQHSNGLGQIDALSMLARLAIDPAAALQWLNQALTLAEGLSGYVITPELLRQAAAAHAACGDFASAYRLGLAADAALKSSQTEAMRKRALALHLRHELDRAHAETEHQQQLARTEARRAAALQENSDTLEILGEVGREVTSSLDEAAIFEALYRHASRLLDTSFFGIARLDEAAGEVQLVYAMEGQQAVPLKSYVLDHPGSSFARCAREQREQIIELNDRIGRVPAVAGTQESLSLLYFPLRVGERLLGVMSVQSPRAKAYRERELAIFRALCGYGAIALDNAQAYRLVEAATAAKGQFLANMSHEIRTPMNAVLGMLKLLQNTALDPRQLDYTVKATGAAKSLLGLINDILDFSKIDAGKMTLDPQPLRLDQLLRDLSVIISTNLGKKPVELLFDIDPQLPPILIGDALRLQQVLINLSGNAIKFTAAGEVVISIRQIGPVQNGQVTLRFAVRDSGIGIAPENQQHIFSGFSQAEASTSRRFGGTGLGLSISKRLVALMGGELALDSVLGQGSTFHFGLTMAIAEAMPETPVDDDFEALPADFSVLVVDDNALARELLEHMAASLGWRVDTAADGQQALKRMEDRRAAGLAPYQTVFMDWEMPGMDGWETMARMRANGGSAAGDEIPITVMVTAHGRERLAERSAEEQARLNGILVKPVTAAMLLDMVRAARAGHSNLRRGDRAGSARVRPLQGLRLLLAEDNELNQQVAQELLEDAGAKVRIAGDGRQAVELLRALPTGFDLVLMDLQMPVLDGFGATRLIREELGLQDLPIVAMTANASASDRAECLAGGMNEHVSKPFELDALVRVLRKLTGRQLPPAASAAAPPQFATLALPAELCARAAAKGIHVQAAIDRFLGKVSLYQRMVDSFAGSSAALPGQLREWLGQADADADADDASLSKARMALHSLKGLAATLGAEALAALAGAGESMLKEAQTPSAAWVDELERVIQEGSAELKVLAMEVAQWAAQAKAGKPA